MCRSYLIYCRLPAGQCKIFISPREKELNSSDFWWLFQVHIGVHRRNVQFSLLRKDYSHQLLRLLCNSVTSFHLLNPPGDGCSEQQYQQQKFPNQSSAPSYRKDQYFPGGQNRGERGRGGWQGGCQSVSEEMPKYITGLYIRKRS